MKLKYLFALVLFTPALFAQDTNEEFSFVEFLGYVKKFHPLVKSANLEISESQANLMAARGAFDPKIEVDFDQKQFKNKEYYSLLNSSFKIPTWYGIEVKAGFDNNDGYFLNPENFVPNNGLASFGIKIPLAQGLLINQRMADLRKAKIQLQLSRALQKIEAINVLFDASIAYFNWKRNFSEKQLYESYLINAQTRFSGIEILIKNGDKPAIDAVEAEIIVKNRQLSLEESIMKLNKAKLELSNFLWLDNNIPFELQDQIIPEKDLEKNIAEVLKTNIFFQNKVAIDSHPKINALQNKLEILNVDQKLKSSFLLPKIDASYYYINEPNSFQNTDFKNYKLGLNFAMPIFLRKERAGLKIAKFKIQDAQFALDLEKLQLTNKIKSQQFEINSIEKQQKIISDLVNSYSTMLQSEERLFSFGESSIFLINTRENSLVTSQLQLINVINKFLIANAELFKTNVNID
ncbi:MAG: TolC family protein [Flavobacterium sp.]|nr:TolC family protein [Flavobacterium sp.]